MIISCTLVITSCAQDEIEISGSTLTPDGKILLSLYVNVPAANEVKTRASAEEENQIKSLNIVIFDSSDKLSQLPATATYSNGVWKVALVPSSSSQKIYALANLSTPQQTILNNLSLNITYDDVRLILTQSDVDFEGVSAPFLMFSDPLHTIISPTMGSKQAQMVRAVAKIDVNVSPLINTSDFTLESVTLLNAAKKYSVVATPSPESLMDNDVLRYTAIDAINNSVESKIYCYENGTSANNPTQLLIKGKYKNGASGYYLLNLVYKFQGDNSGNKYYSIKRNYIYTVSINAVDSPGYPTENEALKSPPTNDMNYDIVVSDSDSHDIISNGQYYLGLSNSECIIYTTEPHSDELVATFTHNAPASVGQGEVVVTGNGISLSGGNPFTASNSTVQQGEIKVNILESFISGTINIRLGNLQKTIKVSRQLEPLSFGGAFNLGDSYIYAKKITDNTEWIKLSSDAEGNTLEDELDHPHGNIHMHLNINFSSLGGIDRYCDLICARNDDQGRVRVKIAQYSFDILNRGGQLDNAFAGTFHRWNETGERVIKMQHSETSIWVATVVTGQEFIKLALGGSQDPKIYSNDPGDPEQYKVEGNNTTIIGSSSDIIFRVGMKTTLENADAEPRYGLILVTHGGGSHRIFVRQGEAADFVFNRDDAWAPGYYTGEERPLAVKWSPYNLTDPALKTGGTELEDHSVVTVGDQVFNANKFTKYPSQIGYFFFRNVSDPTAQYAFHPINCWYYYFPNLKRPLSIKFLDSPRLNVRSQSAYLPQNDPCPAGYRYPNDHNTFNQTASQNKNTSELRQSLAYGNANGGGISLTENSIYGHYADGFFDRLSIISSDIPNLASGKAGTMVVRGGVENIERVTGNDIGMQGLLIFNPFSYKSIFLPSAGRWMISNEMILGFGSSGYYWTTAYSGNQFGNIWSNEGLIQIVYSQGEAHTIQNVRCVKNTP